MSVNVKQHMNKDGAKMVLWGIAIVFILYFASKIMAFIQSMFGMSAEDKAEIEAGKKEFEAYRNKVRNLKGIDWNVAKSASARLKNLLNDHLVDWGAVAKTIVGLSGENFIGTFIEFGIAENEQFVNQPGDMIDWMRKADTPLSFSGGNIGLIKKYIQKIQPVTSSIGGLSMRLKKVELL